MLCWHSVRLILLSLSLRVPEDGSCPMAHAYECYACYLFGGLWEAGIRPPASLSWRNHGNQRNLAYQSYTIRQAEAMTAANIERLADAHRHAMFGYSLCPPPAPFWLWLRLVAARRRTCGKSPPSRPRHLLLPLAWAKDALAPRTSSPT